MINPDKIPIVPDLDYYQLDRQLDKLKAQVFIGKNAAFYGTLLCSVNFVWSENTRTASTTGLSISWNPHFFSIAPTEMRKTVLMHELKHIANLHVIRRGDRPWNLWNMACDYVVNGELAMDGYNMDGFPYYLDTIRFAGLAVEEVYDILEKEQPVMPDYLLDLFDDPDPDMAKVIHSAITNAVIGAQESAALAGQHNGEIAHMLKRFLAPKLPWQSLLYRWFNEKSEQDYSWRKPNRRYSDMYLPSLVESEEGGLDHIMHFQDVSGSISDVEVIRFNSEVKYMKETFNPKKMTLVQFDKTIRDVKVITDADDFNEIQIIGRGGTDLTPVREMIINEQPTAVIIFTDLDVAPMEPLPHWLKVDILWVVTRTGRKAPFGHTINIRE